MKTATRTIETENAIMEIELLQIVSDKIAYMDGANLATGREVYENYEVKLTNKVSGRTTPGIW